MPSSIININGNPIMMTPGMPAEVVSIQETLALRTVARLAEQVGDYDELQYWIRCAKQQRAADAAVAASVMVHPAKAE